MVERIPMGRTGEIDEIVSTMDRVFAQASKELGAE